MIQGRASDLSPLKITLSGHFNDTTLSGNLDIRLVATDMIDGQLLKLRIALTESNINYQAPNGTTIHNQTMRDMIPTATGAAITIAQGETVFVSQAFTCPAPIIWQNSELVVWLQSDGTKEIHQSAVVTLPTLQASVGIDDNNNLPIAFDLAQNYPNPFNVQTVIDYSIVAAGNVNLAVYDLAGRLVNTLQDGNQVAGRHRIIWNGLDSQGRQVSSGIYFYRLQADGKSVTKRMVMLK
jgi:hypothetical protein